MTNTVKKVFLVTDLEDGGEVDKLRADLSASGYHVLDDFDARENSNNAQNEDYIRQEKLKPRLDESKAVIVILTPEIAKSDRAAWVVNYVEPKDKQILAVKTYPISDQMLPDFLRNTADTLGCWDNRLILHALGVGPQFRVTYA